MASGKGDGISDTHASLGVGLFSVMIFQSRFFVQIFHFPPIALPSHWTEEGFLTLK